MRIAWNSLLLVLIAGTLACPPKAPTSEERAAKQAAAPTSTSSSDSRVAAIQDRIEKLNPEARAVLNKVKGMTLTVNKLKSDKALGEIADYIVKKANIEGIGWEAFKNPDGSWFIYYHFKDGQGKLTYAKWHYDVKKDEVVPADRLGLEFSYVAPEKK